MRKIILLFLLHLPLVLFSQNNTIEGQVADSKNNPLSFVNILVYEKQDAQPLNGAVTDVNGNFIIDDLKNQNYYVEFSMVGFTSESKTINPFNSNNFTINLKENVEELDETIVSVKAPDIIREPGKLIFNVENTSLSTGNTFNLLFKTPGVLVMGDNIQVKRIRPIIYINDKRVYLSPSELASLLKSMDASNIKSIEVITNPSAKYGAEATSVLNIITSKAVSVGYKGSINATWEQAVFSKYRFSTAHFYKNDWLNMYVNYSFSPRKDCKQDDNYIRFFNPDNTTTKSIWESDFEKVSRSKAHQGNVILDFTLNDKNTLSFSSTVMMSPNKTYENKVNGDIFNAQQELDSLFITNSYLTNDANNLSFNLEHKIDLNEEGSNIKTSVNFIKYDNNQTQDLNTDYNLPTGELTNNVSFYTDAEQDSNIFTGQIDYTKTIGKGDFETGLKYSNIETESGLDYYNVENNIHNYIENNSDLFIYTESIYAGYLNYAKNWGKWNINVGLRGEFTNVKGDSKSLGIINNREYFDIFPSISALYSKNENNVFGMSYKRSIERPRYQSLNPFTYFITDNIYNSGNPNLVPTLKDKYTISYTLNNKWDFEAYYIYKKNPLAVLSFQDNENNTTQIIDANIISDINFSFDISYTTSLFSWWYLSVYTSTYYLENEFYALASPQETYTNDTYGFYAQMYSGLTLSKDKTLTSDITTSYMSNYIFGSFEYKNQFIFSVSFRKSIWENRASITLGVDDIFNTNNVPLTSKYYNQDNSYFAKRESRLVRVGFKYNFGNYKLRNNKRKLKINEEKRLD
tara:strand:+ start:15990 stop:18395 length:2406 start_codon:yes stop_codon:yes gene_type:complete